MLCLAALPASAERVLVAVASNFMPAMERLVPAYEDASGGEVVVSSGSTGKHFAQISHGAPFDIFLAADVRRPRLLTEKGLAATGSRFTYAEGRLAFCFTGASPPEAQSLAEWFQGSNPRRIAIANPRTAPYGRAARQVLEAHGLWDGLRGKVTTGENVAQAFQHLASGNVDGGFVAHAQVLAAGMQSRCRLVPHEKYEAIRQQAVQLSDSEAAERFLAFLRSDRAARIIRELGYAVPGAAQ